MSTKLACFISLLLLAACGFTPVHGNIQKKAFDQIEVTIIPDRSGQFLRNTLIDRFYTKGYPTTPQYQLNVRPIQETIADFDITIESDATRQQIKLVTTMELIDKTTQKSILNRKLTAVTSNNVLVSEFSTLVAEQNAREAALNDLARQIELQIALFFKK